MQGYRLLGEREYIRPGTLCHPVAMDATGRILKLLSLNIAIFKVSLTLLCILTLFSHDGTLKCENCILKK